MAEKKSPPSTKYQLINVTQQTIPVVFVGGKGKQRFVDLLPNKPVMVNGAPTQQVTGLRDKKRIVIREVS